MSKNLLSKTTFYLILLSFCSFSKSFSQTLSLEAQKEAIQNLSNLLAKHYIFPEKAEKAILALQNNYNNRKYQSLSSYDAFADQITKDLQEITQDKHLNLGYKPDVVKEIKQANTITEPLKNRAKDENYGFSELKILGGNIGYLRLNDFHSPQEAAETFFGALSFFANSYALIIDLRYNNGGDGAMNQLIFSQLYSADTTVHINSFYDRATNMISEMWTIPSIKGKRFPNLPVYVLTSKQTFSAAEELAYCLQTLKRGKVIGEQTKGGANSGNLHMVSDIFVSFIPDGRAINPVTKSNWEGVGVTPDIKVSATDALNTAHLEAIENLAKNAKDSTEKQLFYWNLATYTAIAKPHKVSLDKVKKLVGTYGVRKIFLQENTLYYQRDGKQPMQLFAIDENNFAIAELPNIHLKFSVEKDKSVILTMIFSDGRKETYSSLK